MSRPSQAEADCSRREFGWVVAIGAVVGLFCFGFYFWNDLTTAHYDAKAHLVVARRILDSRAPGYAQLGPQWLPLIHLLYLPFVMIESQYRSGLLPSLISVGAFAVSVGMIFRIVCRAARSRPAAAFAAVLLAANPNLQFFQSSPLTEPLFIMLNLLSLDALLLWRQERMNALPWCAAAWAALAALCRYEGWLFLGGVVLLLAYDAAARRISPRHAARAGLLFMTAGGLPLLLHFGYVYARLGDSFFHYLARGYPAPYETLRRPILSAFYHCGELGQAATLVPLLIGLTGTIYGVFRWPRFQRLAPLLLLWLPSFINTAALYWGLIYRVRYSVLLLPAIAVFGSLWLTRAEAARRVLIGACLLAMALPWLSWAFPREWQYHFLNPGPGILLIPAVALTLLLAGLARERYILSLALLCSFGMQAPLLEGETRAALQEAREHDYLEQERHAVIAHLRENYDGSGILIDMGRQAPLIYDSRLPVREFLYAEGNQAAWLGAMQAPHQFAGWICGEEGDELGNRLRIDPHWAERYSVAVRTRNFMLVRLLPEYRGAPRPIRQPE